MNCPLYCVVKAVIVGDKKTGKTNVVNRICHDWFSGIYNQTIGIDFTSKEVKISNKKIKIQFWDTETTQKSQSPEIKQLLSKGTILMIFNYSVIDGESFTFIEKKLFQYSKILPKSVVKVLLGNKLDSNQQRKVDKEKGVELAFRYEAIFKEVSAKDGSQIKELLYKINQSIFQIIEEEDSLYNL